MYEQFYGLSRRPFENTSNPEFFFASKQHREALAALIYGIKESKGFMLLTGDVGAGKTFVLQSLKYELAEQDHIILEIATPWITPEELFAELPKKLGMDMDPEWGSLVFQARLKEHLEALHRQGRRVLVLLDEAQQLPERTLEGIRLLSNFETPDAKLVQIIFVGQNELNDLLARYSMRQIRQRITLSRSLGALSEEETRGYIAHRLLLAGRSDLLFSEESEALIYAASQGSPRLINLICDNCLITGFAQSEQVIGADTVREVIEDLPLGGFTFAPPTSDKEPTTPTEVNPDAALETVPDVVAGLPHQDRRQPPRWGGLTMLIVGVLLLALPLSAAYWFYGRELSVTHGAEPVAASSPVQAVPLVAATQDARVRLSEAPDQSVAVAPEPEPEQPLTGMLTSLPEQPAPSEVEERVVLSSPPPRFERPEAGAIPGIRFLSPADLPEAALALRMSGVGLPDDITPFVGVAGALKRGVRVPRGENLSSIARQYYGTWNDTVQDMVRILNPELSGDLDRVQREEQVNLPVISRDDLIQTYGAGAFAYVGTLTSRIKSDDLVARLQEFAVPAEVREGRHRSRTLYRVYIGPYQSREEIALVLGNMQLRHMPFLQ